MTCPRHEARADPRPCTVRTRSRRRPSPAPVLSRGFTLRACYYPRSPRSVPSSAHRRWWPGRANYAWQDGQLVTEIVSAEFGVSCARGAGVPGLGSGALLATNDDQGPVAGLACLELHLAEPCGGHLAGKVLGLVAGKAVGGVAARPRLGKPFGQYQPAGRAEHPPRLTEALGTVVPVMHGADRPGHCGLRVWQRELLGLALKPADVRRSPDGADPVREPQHDRRRVDASSGGGAAAGEPDGGAGAAADVDEVVGGGQPGSVSDRAGQRAAPGGHRDRGEDLVGLAGEPRASRLWLCVCSGHDVSPFFPAAVPSSAEQAEHLARRHAEADAADRLDPAGVRLGQPFHLYLTLAR